MPGFVEAVRHSSVEAGIESFKSLLYRNDIDIHATPAAVACQTSSPLVWCQPSGTASSALRQGRFIRGAVMCQLALGSRLDTTSAHSIASRHRHYSMPAIKQGFRDSRHCNTERYSNGPSRLRSQIPSLHSAKRGVLDVVHQIAGVVCNVVMSRLHWRLCAASICSRVPAMRRHWGSLYGVYAGLPTSCSPLTLAPPDQTCTAKSWSTQPRQHVWGMGKQRGKLSVHRRATNIHLHIVMPAACTAGH
jgi:hypothetical protein